MNAKNADDRTRIYDRAFLLSEEKRNQVMELGEVQQFGINSFSDPDYVCVYGMPPAEWYRRGIRLLARTTVEAVRDKLGEMIGKDVERVTQKASPSTKFIVIDPFAGSCNGLYWILRYVRNSKGIGFEIDKTIFELTKTNITFLDRDIELINGDYRALLSTYRFPSDDFLVVFVAPPWADALSEVTGLDLRRTRPPVPDIVDGFESVYNGNPILYVTQVHQKIVPESLADLTRRFDWSDVRIYDINVEGMKHGIVLGTNRWTP